MYDFGVYLLALTKWVIALLLVVSGVSKWMNLGWFARILLGYSLLPKFLIKVMALVIPLIEITIGLLFAFVQRAWPGYAALALLFIVTIAVLVNLLRGRVTLPCGCTGFWKKAQIGWHLIGRNIGLCGLAYLAGPGQYVLRPNIQIADFGVSAILVAGAMLPLASCGKKSVSPSTETLVPPQTSRHWQLEPDQTLHG